jgi:hypothetical protein
LQDWLPYIFAPIEKNSNAGISVSAHCHANMMHIDLTHMCGDLKAQRDARTGKFAVAAMQEVAPLYARWPPCPTTRLHFSAHNLRTTYRQQFPTSCDNVQAYPGEGGKLTLCAVTQTQRRTHWHGTCQASKRFQPDNVQH